MIKKVFGFWPLTASITSEVKINYALYSNIERLSNLLQAAKLWMNCVPKIPPKTITPKSNHLRMIYQWKI